MSEQDSYNYGCQACGSPNHSDCCGADIEEGEVCLFPNMPWIHEFIGSKMERELIDNKGKIPQEEWQKNFELRIAISKHDLRRRGFD
mgnify:CR=1 FL=1